MKLEIVPIIIYFILFYYYLEKNEKGKKDLHVYTLYI